MVLCYWLLIREVIEFDSSEMPSFSSTVVAGWLVLIVSGCFFISPVRSQGFGFFGPLLPPSTVYDITTSTLSQTVGTICYVPATTNITPCRRKRGAVEQPIITNAEGEIDPTKVQR